jgi:monovalent cation:H+ antiporter-2, CPA2 family
MHLPMINDVVIILGLSVLMLFLFHRLRLPGILGFLFAGVVAGPYGLSLVKDVHNVEPLAELGIIFLLFIIGVEFSLKTLSSIKSTVFIGGFLQVGLTIGVTLLISNLFGLSVVEGVFMGFLFALSSTAIVLKILQERGEITSPHGRVTVAILIFQDIIVVPMMLVTPIMAGKGGDIGYELTILTLKLVGLFVLMLLSARYIFPVLLYRLAKSGNREMFLLAIIVICFGSAWLSSSLGLSLALGAFFAGLIISESDYSHEATSYILPFREIFLSFFFVSVGMLLDIRFLITNLPVILGLTFLTFFFKGLIASLAAMALKHPASTVFVVGLSLFQVGEFSFILSKIGVNNGLVSPEHYQYFLSVSILTMGLTPFVIKFSYEIIETMKKSPISPILKGIEYVSGRQKGKANLMPVEQLSDHLVIIGYGLNGKNVARAARSSGIPYVAVEHSTEIYHKERKKEPNLILGNAEDEHILRHLHAHNARVVVVAIADTQATKSIIRSLRLLTKTAEIIVRTRYVRDIDEFLKIGADEVIPEEFETSIEIFTRVLRKYLIPEAEIDTFTVGIRDKNYNLFRSEHFRPRKTRGLHVPDMEITAILVEQGNNSIVGKTVSEAALKEKYGIRIMAIKRKDQYDTRIAADTKILQDDILYLFGKPEEIIRLNEKLRL